MKRSLKISWLNSLELLNFHLKNKVAKEEANYMLISGYTYTHTHTLTAWCRVSNHANFPSSNISRSYGKKSGVDITGRRECNERV